MKRWKTAFGWGLCDIGTSGYFLVFPLYLFPVFLAEHVFAGNAKFELYWGIAQGLAVLLAVAAGLMLGSILDLRGMRRVAPGIVALAPVVSFLLPLCIALDVAPVVLLSVYIVVHAVHLLSLTVYDASLTHVARTGEDRAVVSGWAWGWGYIGGLVCIGLMEIGLFFYPRYSAYDFAVGALYYLIASLFAAKWLRGTLAKEDTDDKLAKYTYNQVNSKSRTPWGLLLSMLLVVDGIAVFMSYTGLYGTRVLRLEERQMTAMLALLQLLAFPLTGAVATLGRRDVPRALVLCGIGWLATVVLLMLASGIGGMLMTIVIVASVVGSTQALLRALYAGQVYVRHEIEGFGKYAVVEKGAAFIGPVVAGSLIPFVGYRSILFASGIAIMIGSLLIWKLTHATDVPKEGKVR